MGKLEHYISVGRDRLRCGYTTGTCAAAAARGAAERLLTGAWPALVRVHTPAGIDVEAELLEQSAGDGWAQCAVRKDGGDDPDVTDGLLIFTRVERRETGGIEIDGGQGVGRVTRPGLDQRVGEAAINSTPRHMIAAELTAALAACGEVCGLKAVVSAPEGAAVAARTFNPRLGIEGGISILGTGGIVRPMSEAALIDSLRLELDMVKAAGEQDVLVTPGNYGEAFCRERLGLSLSRRATCSNYLGEAIDHAAQCGFRSLLLVGHLGKLCKAAAGCMNTHSRVCDARRETLTAHAALCGAPAPLLRMIFESPTTDAVVAALEEAGLREAVMASLITALDQNLKRRAGGALEIEAVLLSNQYGLLGQTNGAGRLLARHRIQEETT